MTESEYLRLKKWFNNYTSGYLTEEPEHNRNYMLKIEHTKSVSKIMKRVAESLNLGTSAIYTARALALCHDVGRFPQYFSYRTFNDTTSKNHASLGVMTLKKESALTFLPVKEQELILQGVALHNMFILPETLDNNVLIYAKLIRDSDKLDIWRVMIDFFDSPPEERASAVVWELPDTGECSFEAVEEVLSGKVLNRQKLKTADDFKLLQLSWVYDLNFSESYRIFSEFGYLDSLERLLKHDKGGEKAVCHVREFLDGR